MSNVDKKKKVTLQDIADEASVSATTVSLFINNKAKKYRISDKTGCEIQRIIDKYNFTPSIHARAIRNQKTYMIGMIIPEYINKSFWMDIFTGVERVVSKKKFHILLSLSHRNAEDEVEALKFMRSKGVDAYIICPLINESSICNADFIRDLNEESTVISLASPFPGIHSVYNDNVAGGALAAKHLFENGHRRVAYLGHIGRQYDFRGKSFIDYFRSRGFEPGCFDSIGSFMQKVEEYTAVFCYSDYWVLDLYMRAKDTLKIPDDLSIIGYDNMDFLDFLSPRPASIHQQKEILGQRTGELLLDLLKNNACRSDNDIKLMPNLITGQSVKVV